MKTLCNYIHESRNGFALLFESVAITEGETLQDVYESFFDECFANYQIDEGFFSKIGNFFKKAGEKAAEAGESADKKIEKMSDAAKKALDSAKEKAGKAWDSVKDAYTSVISSVDDAITRSKESITKLGETFNVKKEELESALAKVYLNAVEKGKEAGKAALEWVSDKTNGVQKIAAVNALVAGALLAKKVGIDSSAMIDILSAAGIN